MASVLKLAGIDADYYIDAQSHCFTSVSDQFADTNGVFNPDMLDSTPGNRLIVPEDFADEVTNDLVENFNAIVKEA